MSLNHIPSERSSEQKQFHPQLISDEQEELVRTKFKELGLVRIDFVEDEAESEALVDELVEFMNWIAEQNEQS